MTHQEDCPLSAELLDQVAEQGLDFLLELIRIMINPAMQAERQRYLGVSPYVRSNERQVHSNLYNPKTVNTRIAPITFDIPQVCEGGFYPKALEKGLLSERASMRKLADFNPFRGMYVHGESIRIVAPIT